MQCLLPALASCVELLAQNHFPAAESHNKCSLPHPKSAVQCISGDALICASCAAWILHVWLQVIRHVQLVTWMQVSPFMSVVQVHCDQHSKWSFGVGCDWSCMGSCSICCYFSGTLSLLLGCWCCLLLSVSIWSVFLSCNDLLQFYVAILDLDPVFCEEGAYTWHIIEPTSHPSPWFHWKY